MKVTIRKKYLAAATLAVCCFIGQPVFAAANPQNDKSNTSQESAAAQSVLTLFEAIDTAVKNNYSLKLAAERINVARYTVTENAAQGLPQLNITTSYGRQDPINAAAPVAGGVGSSPQFAAFLGTSRVNTFRNQVSLSQVLFAGFRVIDGIRLANINVDLAQEGYRQTRQDVVNNVSSAYYNALKSFQLVQVNKSSLKQAELHVEQAKKLEKAGVGIKLDVVRAANQLVNIQLQLSQALNSLEKSKKSLNLAMGRSIDFPFELNVEAKVPQLEAEEEKSLQDALDKRSELKQLKLRKEMDEITTTIQSRTNWPTISANVAYNLTDTAVISGNTVNNQNLNYGLNMNWPVFDGLLTQARVQKAQNAIIQDQINIDQTQQSVILDVKQALLDIQEARERIILAKQGVSLAEESLRISRIRYENGVGISLDVIDSQIALTQAQANLINAEFDLNISRVKLYKAVGIDI
jgi:outer membrane protein